MQQALLVLPSGLSECDFVSLHVWVPMFGRHVVAYFQEPRIPSKRYVSRQIGNNISEDRVSRDQRFDRRCQMLD